MTQSTTVHEAHLPHAYAVRDFSIQGVKKELDKYGLNTTYLKILTYLVFNNKDFQSLLEVDNNPDNAPVSARFLSGLKDSKKMKKILTRLKIFNFAIIPTSGEDFTVTARTSTGELVNFDLVKSLYNANETQWITAIAVFMIAKHLQDGIYTSKDELKFAFNAARAQDPTFNPLAALQGMNSLEDVEWLTEKVINEDDHEHPVADLPPPQRVPEDELTKIRALLDNRALPTTIEDMNVILDNDTKLYPGTVPSPEEMVQGWREEMAKFPVSSQEVTGSFHVDTGVGYSQAVYIPVEDGVLLPRETVTIPEDGWNRDGETAKGWNDMSASNIASVLNSHPTVEYKDALSLNTDQSVVGAGPTIREMDALRSMGDTMMDYYPLQSVGIGSNVLDTLVDSVVNTHIAEQEESQVIDSTGVKIGTSVSFSQIVFPNKEELTHTVANTLNTGVPATTPVTVVTGVLTTNNGQ